MQRDARQLSVSIYKTACLWNETWTSKSTYERTAGVRVLFVSAGIVVHMLTPISSASPLIVHSVCIAITRWHSTKGANWWRPYRSSRLLPRRPPPLASGRNRRSALLLYTVYKSVHRSLDSSTPEGFAAIWNVRDLAGKRNLIGLYNIFNW